jgi:hypothetical protein
VFYYLPNQFSDRGFFLKDLLLVSIIKWKGDGGSINIFPFAHWSLTRYVSLSSSKRRYRVYSP